MKEINRFASFLFTLCFFVLLLLRRLKGAAVESTPDEAKAMSALKVKINGKIIWSSSRIGNHKIFMMNCDGSDTKAITKGNKTDWFSRFSPDGKQIIFCRSKWIGHPKWTPITLNCGIHGLSIALVLERTIIDSQFYLGNMAQWRKNNFLFAWNKSVLGTILDPARKSAYATVKPILGDAAILQTPHVSPDGKYNCDDTPRKNEGNRNL